MALPKLETPTYELILPSTNEKVSYRPFLVKEYKVLLTSLESDTSEIQRVVTDLVDVCTFNKLNAKRLPTFDLEYLFLNIRAKSIGEIADLNMTCKNCENKISFKMDVTKAQILRDENHTSTIFITDKMGVKMRYPNFNEMFDVYENYKSEKIVDLLCNCVVGVFTEEESYDTFTKEELVEFVNSFSKAQFEKLETFFLTMPKVVQEVKEECDKCGTENEVTVEGLQNFFA